MLRAALGPLWGRREQGLSRMVACSFFMHLALFLFMILSRSFWGPQTTSFQSFQVSLIDMGTGPGPGGSASGGGKSPSGTAVSKKASPKPARKKDITALPKQKAPEKAAPAPKPASVKTASKSKPAAPKAAPVVRTPRRAVKVAPPVEKDDPERLEEWWKKQKKTLAVPKSPAAKPKMGMTGRTRTAKIDIQKRPPVIIPKTPLTSPAAKAAPVVSGPSREERAKAEPSVEKEQTLSNEAANTEQETSSSVESGEVSADEDAVSGDGEGTSESVQIGALTGTKGIGAIGGGGGGFNFPGYLQKVDQKIRWQWAPPPVSSSRDRLIVRFMVRKDGTIDLSSVGIEESSGSRFFDQAALRAVVGAKKLPPLPKAYHESVLTIYMEFMVTEDS